MIAIVDYGSGNIQAVKNIYDRLNIKSYFANCPDQLTDATKIVLPGVGSFDQAMAQLEASGMKDKLNDLVLNKNIPILGVCVGMQLMAESSEEGTGQGLGWFDAKVRLIDSSNIIHKPKLPHMGWNSVTISSNHLILDGIDLDKGFYFLHSYYFDANHSEDVLLNATYGDTFNCAIRKGNIFGFQFHPEKSHSNGIKIFENFAGI